VDNVDTVEIPGDKAEDTVITRVGLTCSVPGSVVIPPKYREIFQGKSVVGYGRYVYRYPVTNTTKQRLLTAFTRDFPQFKVDLGVSGIDAI